MTTKPALQEVLRGTLWGQKRWKYIHKYQKQQILERTREHHQKLQCYKQQNGNKFLSSVLTLNVNGLNAPIKRHRVTEWIRKQYPSICCLQETHFRPKDTFRLKVRRWRTICHANGQQKKAGVAILISDNIDFKIKTVTRSEEGNRIIIKRYIHQKT